VYLTNLAIVVAAEEASEPSRRLAALLIKNALNAREDQLQLIKHEKWMVLDATVRANVKTPILSTLRSPVGVVAGSAAQAAAEIAAVELPFKQWPEFLPTLLDTIQSQNFPEVSKNVSLDCLGYTCERISILGKDVDEQSTDSMLNAIVTGIDTKNPDATRLAAANALKNSLVFANKNMEKPEECQAIMQSLCEATRAQDERVRISAYEGIVQVALLYYDKLQNFMTTLYELSTATIKTDKEDVAKSAIEFWTSLCEVEQDLIDEETLARDQGLPVERPCMRYVAAALTHLVPILLETLTKQDEHADEDDYTLHMAGQVCLTSISQTVEDAVVPVVMPFINQHINSADWRYKDAAILAFIGILDGPQGEVIGPAVSQSVPVLLALLNDPNEMIRDSAAHAISRIGLLHVRFIPPEIFPQLLDALTMKCIDGSAKVASQAASAIYNLASAFSEEAANETQATNALSQFMQTVLQRLLTAVDRQDADESNLRVAAMEAISELISVAAQDVLPMLGELLPLFILRFQQTLQIHPMNEEEKLKKEQVQGLLCAVIQSLYRKLDKSVVLPHTDSAMEVLCGVLSVKNCSCQEECFSAISAITDTIEGDFVKYMNVLAPLIVSGLKNFEAYQVCIVAVGLVGDISRSIESAMVPYCDDIMNAMVEDLKDSSIHRSVKPPVLSAFGDIAMAIGGAYQPYLQFSMLMLMQASNTTVPPGDEDLVEYLNLLRESILEAYVGIIQGLRDGDLLKEFYPYVDQIFLFLEQIAVDPNRDEYVLTKAVGLVGDFAQLMGPAIKDKIMNKQPVVQKLLQDAANSGDASLVETSAWARSVIQQAVQAH
jgi:importin subunit beta-1